jgi:hypothetical protein
MQDFQEILDCVNFILSLPNVHEFEDLTNSSPIKHNIDRFCVWYNVTGLQSWEEIKQLPSLRRLKILPVYINDYDTDYVYLSQENIIKCLEEDTENISFNILNCGFVEGLKMPRVLDRNEDSETENFWVKFPAYPCCPLYYVQKNYRNSLIMTSRNVISRPHTDVETPGTTVLSLLKGRKIFICLQEPLSQEEISLEEFLDAIISKKKEAFYVDMASNDVISFPVEAFHFVITLENSIAAYFQVLGQVEIDHYTDIGLNLDLSGIQKPSVFKNHICLKDESFGSNLTLESIYSLKMHLQRAIPFSLQEDASFYSFNDLFFHISKLLTQKQVAIRRSPAKDLYVEEEYAIFEQAGIDVKILRLAFNFGLMIHDLLKYQISKREDPSIQFTCGLDSMKTNLPFIREMGTIIPILTTIPEEKDMIKGDTFRARFCRHFSFQKALLLRKLALNLHASSVELYNGIPLEKVFQETQKDLLLLGLLPEKMTMDGRYKYETQNELETLKNLKQQLVNLLSDPIRKRIMNEFDNQ